MVAIRRALRLRKKTDRQSVFVAGALALSALLHAGDTRANGHGELEATRRFCQQQVERSWMRAQLETGKAAVAQSEVLPNPTLSGNYQQVLGGIEEQELTAGLSVPLGIGGQRFVRQDAAAAWSEQMRLAAGADRLAAAIAYRRAFAMASLDRARLAVRRAQLDGYRQLLERLAALAAAGESARHDRMRLTTAAELMTASIAPLEAQLAAQRAWLEAMGGAPVKLSDEPATLARRSATGDVPHPQVESLEAAARASALDARAARRAAVPDIRLFGGYRMLNSGSDTGHGFALGLSLPLTFFDHGQGSARRADAKRTMAEARSQRLQRDNRARRLAASARERALADSSERLDRAIKLALEVRGNAERLYLAAEGSLLAVLAAHNRVAALKLARIEIGASAARARLDAMAASGRLGDPATDVACGASRP